MKEDESGSVSTDQVMGKFKAVIEVEIKEEKEDPAITFRKKVDAKRLVPTRSGSKGGNGGGSGDGGDGDGGE